MSLPMRWGWITFLQVPVRALLAMAGVVVLSFAMTRLLPGDPVALLGAAPGMETAALQELRQQAGLDRPVLSQFLSYVHDLARGDLGHSVSTGNPVGAEIARRLPASLELALAGFVPALLLVLGIGLLIARAPGGHFDRLARGVVALGAALPVFVSGLLLIQLFYVQAGWVVAPIGRIDPLLAPPPSRSGMLVADALMAGDLVALRSVLAHLVLPATTIALFALVPMLRVFRAAVLAARVGPGVIGARAIGLPERVVLWRYLLPEALGPLIPVAGVTFGYMLGASVLVEKVFAWPGVGRYALDALAALDYPPVQGVMLVLAGLHVLLTLLADLLARWLDPRVAREDA